MNPEFHFLHSQGCFQLHGCLGVVDPTISMVVSPSFPGGVGITCWLVVCNKVVAIMLHPFSWRNPSNPWSPQLHLHCHYFKLISTKRGQLSFMGQGLRQSLLFLLGISQSFGFLFPEIVFQFGKNSIAAYRTSFWVCSWQSHKVFVMACCHQLLKVLDSWF